MTAALVALATTCLVLAGTILLLVRMHSVERRMLIDRVIARHAGEAIALDRSPRTPKPGQSPEHPVFERPVAVGL